MPADPPLSPPSNPFATRFTRPGAGEYLFPANADAGAIVARLQDQNWWGQITGPHGSGKSTLVHTLLPELHAAGRRTEFYSLHQPVSRPCDTSPAAVRWRDHVASWNDSTQIVIDGFEQLGRWRRVWLPWQCRRRQAGLLVTAHRDWGLPDLWRTETSMELAQQLVARLLGEDNAGWTGAEQVERLYAEHGGNLREVLFALYDLYERRSP